MHCSLRRKRPKCDSDFSAIVVPSMRGSGYLDYTVENHASRSLLVMDEFRRHEVLCDLMLRVTFKEMAINFKVIRMKSERTLTRPSLLHTKYLAVKPEACL